MALSDSAADAAEEAAKATRKSLRQKIGEGYREATRRVGAAARGLGAKAAGVAGGLGGKAAGVAGGLGKAGAVKGLQFLKSATVPGIVTAAGSYVAEKGLESAVDNRMDAHFDKRQRTQQLVDNAGEFVGRRRGLKARAEREANLRGLIQQANPDANQRIDQERLVPVARRDKAPATSDENLVQLAGRVRPGEEGQPQSIRDVVVSDANAALAAGGGIPDNTGAIVGESGRAVTVDGLGFANSAETDGRVGVETLESLSNANRSDPEGELRAVHTNFMRGLRERMNDPNIRQVDRKAIVEAARASEERTEAAVQGLRQNRLNRAVANNEANLAEQQVSLGAASGNDALDDVILSGQDLRNNPDLIRQAPDITGRDIAALQRAKDSRDQFDARRRERIEERNREVDNQLQSVLTDREAPFEQKAALARTAMLDAQGKIASGDIDLVTNPQIDAIMRYVVGPELAEKSGLIDLDSDEPSQSSIDGLFDRIRKSGDGEIAQNMIRPEFLRVEGNDLGVMDAEGDFHALIDENDLGAEARSFLEMLGVFDGGR